MVTDRKCKTVSFDLTDKYERQLLEYIESQGKFSKVVKRLIANSMKEEKTTIKVTGQEIKEETDLEDKDAMDMFF